MRLQMLLTQQIEFPECNLFDASCDLEGDIKHIQASPIVCESVNLMKCQTTRWSGTQKRTMP